MLIGDALNSAESGLDQPCSHDRSRTQIIH
jgi:hypothetical protein